MTSEAPASRGKARPGMSRRNQLPSKRVAQRKAGTTSNETGIDTNIATNTNPASNLQTASSNQNENNQQAANGLNDDKNNKQSINTTTTTTTNPSAASSSTQQQSQQQSQQPSSSSTTTSNTNFWQNRKQQQKKDSTQNKKSDVSSGAAGGVTGTGTGTSSTASIITTISPPKTTSGSSITPTTNTASATTSTQPAKYMPVKLAPAAVEPSKRAADTFKRPAITVESIQQPIATPESKRITKNPASEETTTSAATAPTSSGPPSRFASGGGYRTPHQRGTNAVIVKPPEETEAKKDSQRDKPTSNYSFRDRETKNTDDDSRPLRREAMGKGYERKQLSENITSNDKPETGRRFPDDTGNRGRGFGSRGGFGRGGDRYPRDNREFPRREYTETAGEGNRTESPNRPAIRSERDVNTTEPMRNKYENTATKNDASINRRNITEKESDNLQYGKNATRSQSLKNDTRGDPRSRTTPSKPLQKTYSAPKEQLMKVVKLHGPSEHKDDKIMKIKQQMKEKEKATKPNTATIGGFQPVLSSAQEALRAISDGNMDITRENAEMVQRELGTNLNPLGPEFAPQDPMTEIDGDQGLEQGHYGVDQSQFTSEQGSGYDTGNVARNGTETEDLSNLSWSFHPSDSGVYAQDFGGEVEYDMNNYVDFERNQEMGADPNMGPNNSTMGTSGLPPNGARSQSPEHMPVSHSINDAYNTQSTVTMASQSLPVTAPGPSPNMLNTGYNAAHATEDLSTQQAPSEAQQVAMKAQQAIQQNPQMFGGNEHGGNAPAMVSINPAMVLRYQQQFSGSMGEHNQAWPVEELNPMYLSMWQQQQRMNATGHAPQSAPQNQPTYVSHYNTMAPPSETGHPPRREWNRRSRGGHQGRQYRGRGRRRFEGQDTHDSNNPSNEMDSNTGGNTQMGMGRGRYNNDRRDYAKRKYPQQKRNYGYRTKEHGFAHQNRDPNDNINGAEVKGHELNPDVNQQTEDRSNTNQWGNMQGDYGTYGYDGNAEQMMGTFDSEAPSTDKGNQKEEDNLNFPSNFETLTLSDWYIILDSSNPQHLENFQNQLFETSPPNSLKNFRLELPSSPIQPIWIDRVRWTQLSEYLSQAKLECVEITSHLQNKQLDVYTEKDFQELQPVARFVTSLKCKRLTLEHAPCKITPDFIQSLSNEIEELKLLCPSIEWNAPLVRSLNPRLSYLALICPNTTITIRDFLHALEGKINTLYLSNDESCSRSLSSDDVWELFKSIPSLELDVSLLSEIHPVSFKTKTVSLVLHLKDKALDKDFYQKCSFPQTITSFNMGNADPSLMRKGWNDTTNVSTGPSSKEFAQRSVDEDESKINTQHKAQHARSGYEEHAQGLSNASAVAEDHNKLLSNDSTSEQNQGQGQSQGQISQGQNQGQGQGPTKKMSFKEKLQSGQKAKKTSTLRIGGN